MVRRNQYTFIDSCSCRTLTQVQVQGWEREFMTVLPHYPCRNPQKSALGFIRAGACSLTWLQQQQLTQDPSQQGEFAGPADYPLHRPESPTKPVAAAAEGTASPKENIAFTKDYFQTITQSLSKQCIVFQKKEVHKVVCGEWHRNRNIRTKQLRKPGKKLHSQNRMQLRTWNKHIVLKQKELEKNY